MSNILNYKKGLPFLFISYSSKDKSIIVEDIIEIQKRGVNVWFDADLTVGTDWFNNEVRPKILQCKAVLFYISQYSIQSKQVLKEIETALERKKQIIPICILPTISTIGNYIEDYSHTLTIDIDTAYKMADIISGDNTFIPHKTDKDYYDALIEKGIKRLAPGAINQNPQQDPPAAKPLETAFTTAEHTFNHTITNTEITYRLLHFKKSTGIQAFLSPNMPVTLIYKGIKYETKAHAIKLGRIPNVAFVWNIPVGTELSVAFDGVNTFTLTDAAPQV